MSATQMRLTEFASSQIDGPMKVERPQKVDEPASYGPPQWARRSWTSGFAGADFALQPDGTLRCPAGQPLYPQERRAEHNGSVRVLYAARIGHCRACPLRSQCQESPTSIKPRRVSAVFWPQTSTTSPPNEPLSNRAAPSRPVLWGDWQCCHLQRSFFQLLRTQTILITFGPAQRAATEQVQAPAVQTRAQRAHWRLNWQQRLARNARPPTSPPLEITLHGLPVQFVQKFGFDVLTAA